MSHTVTLVMHRVQLKTTKNAHHHAEDVSDHQEGEEHQYMNQSKCIINSLYDTWSKGGWLNSSMNW